MQVDGAVLRSLRGDDSVQVDLDHDHVNGRSATVLRIGDAVPAHGEPGSIGYAFLGQ
jgi:hypothetical protein